ncbi:MAG: cupin domain-containing protein [Candidatus Baltobacteraceae bacterium]
MSSYSRPILIAAALAALYPVAAASASAPIIVTVETAKWQSGTGAFKGTEFAAVVGNHEKPGEYYSYLLKMPDGFHVPPHYHGKTENVNVISGTLMVGIGDTFDTAKMTALPAGAIVSVPADVHHYAMSKGPTVIEISGIGPDSLTLVHP